MTRRSRSLHAGILILAAALLAAAPAHAGNEALSKPFTYTVGDAIAARAQGIFRTLAGLETSTLVYYDRDARTITVEIVGGADEVGGAKREVEAYVVAIRESVVDYAKKQHHIALGDRDVTLIYYNPTDEGSTAEVIRREKGVYIVPKPDKEGDGGE